MSSSPTMTIIKVDSGMRSRLGRRIGMTSPGITAISALGIGSPACGSAASAAICAARFRPGGMADQGEPRRIRPDMVNADVQDPQGVVQGRHRVGQEVLRHGPHIVLVAREDDDPAVPNQVVDPGAVEPRIDREPAVEEDDHRRPFRPGLVRLEQPVRARPLPDLEPADVEMRRRRLLAWRLDLHPKRVFDSRRQLRGG